MSERTITITLPEQMYLRARETAEATASSMEDVLTRSIALSLPPLEKDLPTDVRSELAALALLDDQELRRLANQFLAEDEQTRLASLAEIQKTRTLSESEQSRLDELLKAARLLMLRKAEAYRLLAQRGLPVFMTATS